MPIQLKSELADALNKAMQSEGEARLPFPAPVLWVMNGNKQLKTVGGALYFGGWACGADDFEQSASEMGLPVPPTFMKHEYSPKNGSPVQVYSTRHITVAPIAKRLSSVDKLTNIRYPGYHKGASPHLQVLCLLAYKDSLSKEQKRITWGTIVLSAKGYQVGYILTAFQEWESFTSKARREFAPGLRSNLFFMTIGTFGKEPAFESVGKGDKTSPITPVQLYKAAEGMDEKSLEYLFVGDAHAEQMVAFRNDASDWMKAWAKTSTEEPEFPLDPPEEELPV